MDKHYAIFDMDGTLIDSMPVWRTLGKTYLRTKGIVPPADLRKVIAPMTMLQSAEYFQTLGVPGRAPQIAAELDAWMRKRYESDIPARPGAGDYLAELKARGVRCCVATATDPGLAGICLDRLKLLKYFEFIVSCETIGCTKTAPDIYHLAAGRLGAVPAQIAVYEDAPYAAETARRAGYYTVGVFDDSPEASQERLKAACNEYILSFSDAAESMRNQGR